MSDPSAPRSERVRRVGPLVWAMAALALVAAFGLYFVIRAEPAAVEDEELIVVPETPTPTPLMKPKTAQ